jgi:hypothetical protein
MQFIDRLIVEIKLILFGLLDTFPPGPDPRADLIVTQVIYGWFHSSNFLNASGADTPIQHRSPRCAGPHQSRQWSASTPGGRSWSNFRAIRPNIAAGNFAKEYFREASSGRIGPTLCVLSERAPSFKLPAAYCEVVTPKYFDIQLCLEQYRQWSKNL